MTPRPPRSTSRIRSTFAPLHAALLLTAVLGCQPKADSQVPSSAAAAPITEPSPFAHLDLGFEREVESSPWDTSRSRYPTSRDTTQAAEGSASLHVVHDGVHRHGGARLELPIEAVRGQAVHVEVKIRAEKVDRGEVGVRLVARRGVDELARNEVPFFERIRGTADWTSRSVALNVPADTDAVVLWLDHSGTGHAWFDDVEVTVAELPAVAKPPQLRGRVLDGAGNPVANALVAGFSQTGTHATTRSDADGEFAMQVEAGTYALGISGPAGVATVREVVVGAAEGAADDGAAVEVTLDPGTTTLRGTVVDGQGRPFGGVLAVIATDDDSVFPTRTADDGSWMLQVPAANRYMAVLEADDGNRTMAMIDDPSVAVASTLPRETAAPPAAVGWVADHHVPLSSVDPTAPLGDMRGLDAMVGNATVVGMGEATHGTREFFQMKHRMFRYLVEHHGFRVFAIEANRTECRAIDAYVQTGEGDPKQALRGIYFWTWNTEEVLALIEWMRAYNTEHPDDRVHFVGFDAQTPDVAARNVAALLERVDVSAQQRAAIQRFSRPWNAESFAELPKDEQDATLEHLAALAERFETDAKTWAGAVSADELANAADDLTVVRQVLSMRRAPGMEAFAARDRAMADNVLAIEQRYGKGTKTMLWAHNGHIARAWAKSEVMGQYLGRALGDRYVSVGFAFDRGGFQAIAIEADQFTGLREHQVGSAKNGDFETALREGGPALFALDLRTLPEKGEAAAWLRSPLPMRQIGAGFSDDDMSARAVESVPGRFDLLLFVEQTTRARPLPRH